MISDRLREAIRAYGSVYAVARDTGIDQTTLNRFYRGERDIGVSKADKLAEFFGMRLTKARAKRSMR